MTVQQIADQLIRLRRLQREGQDVDRDIEECELELKEALERR